MPLKQLRYFLAMRRALVKGQRKVADFEDAATPLDVPTDWTAQEQAFLDYADEALRQSMRKAAAEHTEEEAIAAYVGHLRVRWQSRESVPAGAGGAAVSDADADAARGCWRAPIWVDAMMDIFDAVSLKASDAILTEKAFSEEMEDQRLDARHQAAVRASSRAGARLDAALHGRAAPAAPAHELEAEYLEHDAEMRVDMTQVASEQRDVDALGLRMRPKTEI